MKLLVGLFFLIFSGLFAEESPPAWMMEQIEADFAAFKKISVADREKMDQKIQRQNNAFRCRIENNRPHFFGKDLGGSKFYEMEKTLNELTRRYSLPDMDFFICLEDQYFSDKNPAPLLVFSKKKEFKTQVRIPSECELDHPFAWTDKFPIVWWRGDTSGGTYNSANWRSYPRSKAVLLSLEHPDKIDARFLGLTQGAQHVAEMLNMPDLLADYVCPCKFKYHLFFEDALTFYGSVIFRQKTDRIRWYEGALMPFVHYLPVAKDLSDLLGQVAWAQEHDEEAHRIAENSVQLCLNTLNEDARYLYFYLVLLKYAQLF